MLTSRARLVFLLLEIDVTTAYSMVFALVEEVRG